MSLELDKPFRHGRPTSRSNPGEQGPPHRAQTQGRQHRHSLGCLDTHPAFLLDLHPNQSNKVTWAVLMVAWWALAIDMAQGKGRWCFYCQSRSKSQNGAWTCCGGQVVEHAAHVGCSTTGNCSECARTVRVSPGFPDLSAGTGKQTTPAFESCLNWGHSDPEKPSHQENAENKIKFLSQTKDSGLQQDSHSVQTLTSFSADIIKV